MNMAMNSILKKMYKKPLIEMYYKCKYYISIISIEKKLSLKY